MLLSSSLARGDVVLASFPFADLSATKRRPAVIIGTHPAYGELTLAFVTSQHTAYASDAEVLILPSHPEFPLSGLSAASKLRADKLVTLASHLLTRKLGRLGPLLTADLNRALVNSLTIDLLPFLTESGLQERERLATVYQSGGPQALIADLGLSPNTEE